MTTKTPEQIAAEIAAEVAELGSVSFMGLDNYTPNEFRAEIARRAIEADRAQRDTYTFDEETAAEAGAWKKGEQFWEENAGIYVAGYVDGWRGDRKLVSP